MFPGNQGVGVFFSDICPKSLTVLPNMSSVICDTCRANQEKSKYYPDGIPEGIFHLWKKGVVSEGNEKKTETDVRDVCVSFRNKGLAKWYN
jgi:hypothetical protein